MTRSYAIARLYQSPGDLIRGLISDLKTHLINGYLPGQTPQGLTFELGEFDVYRSVIFVEIGDGFEAGYHHALTSLGSDESAPTRFFSDSPGWSDRWSLGVPGGSPDFERFPFYVDAMGLIHGIKTSVLEEWGRSALRRTDIDGTDALVLPLGQAYTRTSVYDSLGEQVVDVDRCAIYRNNSVVDESGPDGVLFISAMELGSGADGGSTGSIEISSISESLKDIAMRDVEIRIDNGRVVVSAFGRVGGEGS